MRIYRDKKETGGRRDDRGGDNKKSYGGGGRSDRPDMHSAVCDDCGKDCKVPFKPSSDKPIYCSDCFNKSDNKHSDRGGRGNDRGGRDSGGSDMHSATCDDCGNECRVPFRPTQGKPIYCSSCFENRGNTHDSGRGGRGTSSSNSAQLTEISEKLDKILSIIIED